LRESSWNWQLSLALFLLFFCLIVSHLRKWLLNLQILLVLFPLDVVITSRLRQSSLNSQLSLALFLLGVLLVTIKKIIFDGFTGNAVAPLGPCAQIDQLATLGAKGPVGVVFPSGFFAAGGTLYAQRHRGN
jgi:hypothetical protein